MNKIKVLALFGKSASGKDTLQQWIVSNYPQLHPIISCTTRPPRVGELEGVNYFFLKEVEFEQKIKHNLMLEYTVFREWYYGTSLDQLDPNSINVGVFNVAGIRTLLQDPRLEVIPVLVDASDKTRLLRSLYREEFPACREICRRFLADEEDFQNINFNYIYWLNEDGRHDTWQYRTTHLENILKAFRLLGPE